MRLFTDQPQILLTASRDTYLTALVAEDNGGPEDVVIDCMFPSLIIVQIFDFPCCYLILRLTQRTLQACLFSPLTEYLEP